MTPPRIICYGLGPVGVGIAEVALQQGYEIAGAVDVDPAKAGRPLGDLVPGGGAIPVDPTAERVLGIRGGVVLHSTQSRLAQIMPQVSPLLEAGLDVISTCEELAFPWRHRPRDAAALDAAARGHEATIVGVGVNPGFIMDVLPVLLASPCVQIRSVQVERVVDVGRRRLPLQQKVGAGLTVEVFRTGVEAGRLGHVGLPQSAAMIAWALGWELDDLYETVEPVIGPDGLVAGLHQVCRGRRGEDERIVLDLTMSEGAPDPHDAIRIDGVPPITLRIPSGVHGDRATYGIVVNTIPRILAARPGLLTPVQLALAGAP